MIGAQSAVPPLKRPGLGRPRGRPPGPKQPGTPRAGRGRGASSSTAWQNMMLNQSKSLKYFMQYQQDLLQQYNNLSQQLNTYMPGTTQSSLLSPTQLLQVRTNYA